MSYLARLKKRLADSRPETGPPEPVPKVPEAPFGTFGTDRCRGFSDGAPSPALPRDGAPIGETCLPHELTKPTEGPFVGFVSDRGTGVSGNDAPAAWRLGVARLDPEAPPCPCFRTGEWAALHRSIRRFMDEHAAQAARCGWGTLDLFGVDPEVGAAAVDRCGALMLPMRHPASAVTPDAIAFGPLTYRKRPLPGAVPAWDATPRRAVPGNE